MEIVLIIIGLAVLGAIALLVYCLQRREDILKHYKFGPKEILQSYRNFNIKIPTQ